MQVRLFWLMWMACGMRRRPGMPMRPLSGWHPTQFFTAGRGSWSVEGFMLRYTAQMLRASLARHLTEAVRPGGTWHFTHGTCLLYTSDAADDLLCVDLGGRRFLKKKKSTSRLSWT